jgi:hypothetical protein
VKTASGTSSAAWLVTLRAMLRRQTNDAVRVS